MSGKIRVLIVDDIAESRDNVAKLLRFEPDVDVVGMADNGEQALSLCERLEPSIVLLDMEREKVIAQWPYRQFQYPWAFTGNGHFWLASTTAAGTEIDPRTGRFLRQFFPPLATGTNLALLNGLRHDLDEETAAVTAFGKALDQLLHTIGTDGLRVPAMREPPARTLAAIPGLAEEIVASTATL